MNFIASLEPHVVMYILSSISEGLTALGKELLMGFVVFANLVGDVCLGDVNLKSSLGGGVYLSSQTQWFALVAAPAWTT